MSNNEKLNKVQALVAQGKHKKAREILETITSKDPSIRVDVLLTFLVVLDHVTENGQLLEVTNEGLELTNRTGNESIYSYFLGRKSIFLLSRLSTMVHREKNLVLSANVFKWIDFSLERDKKEYESILEKRKELEKEIDQAIAATIERTDRGIDNYLRGHLFSAIGDFYSSRYLCDKLDFQKGGRIKSKIANMYFVRRWNLDKFLYDRVGRKKLEDSKKKCFQYFERSILEFRLAGKKSEEANAIYNLAVKFKIFYHFSKVSKLLTKAKVMAEELKEKPLLDKISMLKKESADKNRHLQDRVSELSLDMP